MFDDDSFYHRNTNDFDSDNMAQFIDELDEAFDIQSVGLVSDTGSTITYNVSFLPRSGKDTTSRLREDILNKNQ